MKYDKIIANLFFIEDKINRSVRLKFDKRIRQGKYKNLQEYLFNRFADYDDIKEILYRIKYNIEERPVCMHCGSRVNFVGKGGVMFNSFCCWKCRSNSEETWKKIKQTNIKNWGTPGVYDSPKYQEKLFKEKGYRNYLQSEEFQQKRTASLIEHYGTTNLYSIPEIKEKSEQTCMERFGVKNGFLMDKAIKAKDEYYHSHPNKTSQPENIVYEIIKSIYPTVKRQYKSDKYPFRADFYIPETDTYIECQFSQYHHFKKFENTDEDKLELERLKVKSDNIKKKNNKTTSQYDKIIYVWTDLDVRKRQTAKDNNLNFIEFWNIQEVKEYFNIN